MTFTEFLEKAPAWFFLGKIAGLSGEGLGFCTFLGPIVDKAMGITKEHYGEDLCGDTIFVTDNNTTLTDEQIDQTPRINIDYAEEASKYPWRFVIKEKYL
jgi:hypothetical protein